MFGLVSKRKVMDVLYRRQIDYEQYMKMGQNMKNDDLETRARLQAGAIRRVIEEMREELA